MAGTTELMRDSWRPSTQNLRRYISWATCTPVPSFRECPESKNRRELVWVLIFFVSLWQSAFRQMSFRWQPCMLVAMLVICRERLCKNGSCCLEVMMGWRGAWSPFQPTTRPPEGPPRAKVTDSGRTLHHSQGPSPGNKCRGKRQH